MEEMIKFDMPKNQSSIIKVIGVGGGGSNAVTHMYSQGIKGVDFIICNTDAQAMEISPIPTKVQLGDKGLGAGSIPSVGRESAQQKITEIRELLEKNTKMLFITAGMGGGTGTGAAPVIASIAKELNILTVGIVTLPFSFEGRKRRQQAEEGIKELRKHTDTLLMISNDKLREVHGDLKLSEAFQKADNVLATAAKGIAEIITVTGYINVDFEDVKTVMKDSGKAIMGSAEAEGDDRAIEAIRTALSSPLLNDNDIEGASNVLLYIASGEEEISMDEVMEITDYIQNEAKSQAEIIWGNGIDKSLGNKISITLIATGFDTQKKIRETENESRRIFTLDGDVNKPGNIQENILRSPREKSAASQQNRPERVLRDDEEESVDMEKISLIRSSGSTEDSEKHKKEAPSPTISFDLYGEIAQGSGGDREQDDLHSPEKPDAPAEPGKKTFELYIRKPETQKTDQPKKNEDDEMEARSRQRIEKLRQLSHHFHKESDIEALEKVPAYLRKNIELNESKPSEEKKISRFSLYENDDKKVEIKTNNSFLHDNVD